MPRVMEITTPLGPDVLLFHTMHAREELSRVCECRLELLSLKNDINLDQILGKNVTVKLALQDDKTRYFNGFVSRFSQGGSYGRYRRYYASRASVALVPVADGRLPHLPGQDRSGDRQDRCSANTRPRRSRTTRPAATRKWTYCVQYRETDLNFVSRLLETRRHLLLLHARRREAHAGDGRLLQRPRAVPGRSPFRSSIPTRSAQAGHRARQRVEPDARDPARRLRARRLRFRAAERRAADAEGGVAQLLAKRLRGLRLPGGVSPEVGRRSERAPVRIDEFAAQFETAQGGDQRQEHQRRVAVQRSNAARAPIRIASTWWSRPPTTWSTATTRRCRSAAGPSTGAASSPCRASSSSGRGA